MTSASESVFSEAYLSLKAEEGQTILLRFQEDAYINSGGIAIL